MPFQCNRPCKPEHPSDQDCEEPQQPKCGEKVPPQPEPEPSPPSKGKPPKKPECGEENPPPSPEESPKPECEDPKQPGGGDKDPKQHKKSGHNGNECYSHWSVGRNNITGSNQITTSGTNSGISM